MSERVVFTGFVSDQERDILLRQAQVFVYPSHYEGFGIPVLEAMKVGTPVVASNVTAMPEVVTDAGLLVDPCDPAAMAAAIGRLLNDEGLRATLVDKGHARAAAFTWADNCERYLGVYRELAGRGDTVAPI